MNACVKNCGRNASGEFCRYCEECRSKARRRPALYVPTPEIDAVIAEAYRKGYGTGACQFASHKTGWPTWAVKRRALALDLVKLRKREPAWSEHEVSVLREFIWMGEDRLRLKLARVCGTKRTKTAIHLKKKRLKLRVGDADGYSGRAFAELLGVDPRAVSRRWISFGWLKAEKRGTNRVEAQGGDGWWITRSAAYRFLIAHPDEIDLARVDKLWFLNLITAGKIPLDLVEQE